MYGANSKLRFYTIVFYEVFLVVFIYISNKSVYYVETVFFFSNIMYRITQIR